jgi:hypothetical protein
MCALLIVNNCIYFTVEKLINKLASVLGFTLILLDICNATNSAGTT